MDTQLKDPAASLPDDAPKEVKAAARDEEVTPRGERVATAWFRSPHVPIAFKVDVDFDADDRTRKLKFSVLQLEGPLLEKIERRNTEGEPPFGKMDELQTAAEIVAESVLQIDEVDGETINPGSTTFRTAEDGTELPSIALALRYHFRYQSGTLITLAQEIRRISGFSTDRVGQASRILIETAGN